MPSSHRKFVTTLNAIIFGTSKFTPLPSMMIIFNQLASRLIWASDQLFTNTLCFHEKKKKGPGEIKRLSHQQIMWVDTPVEHYEWNLSVTTQIWIRCVSTYIPKRGSGFDVRRSIWYCCPPSSTTSKVVSQVPQNVGQCFFLFISIVFSLHATPPSTTWALSSFVVFVILSTCVCVRAHMLPTPSLRAFVI